MSFFFSISFFISSELLHVHLQAQINSYAWFICLIY